MKKKIETILTFMFLVFFSIGTLYPVLNILSVSLKTDNAFHSQSLALIQIREKFEDINNNN